MVKECASNKVCIWRERVQSTPFFFLIPVALAATFGDSANFKLTSI